MCSTIFSVSQRPVVTSLISPNSCDRDGCIRIFNMVASLALCQQYDCPSKSEMILNGMGNIDQ